ncbi:IcmF-related protein [Collimonas arenae]|uniref:IcmF-related protein n=1 Tax=Collimonas arenae TaxID=279058 RepID=A0A0A1FCI4_9BURK|nr:ImcF-related family protein [Collimonas arenae]AIY41490.1 IcmF-related protein [Collimonas arenae]
MKNLFAKISGHMLLVATLTIIGLIAAYYWGAKYDPVTWHRMTLVLLICSVLTWFGPLTRAAIGWLSSHAPGRQQFKRDPAARASTDKVELTDPLSQRIQDLKDYLKEQHGWRWRYCDRWLLLCGDNSAIDLLAPTLRHTGWAITPDAVLLYSGKAADEDDKGAVPDVAWLKQIARLRPRRPVDAMVVVISSGKGALTADKDMLARKLYIQSSALGWAAPTYLLNATELEHAQPHALEEIGCTWSVRGGDLRPLDNGLGILSNRLAERGVDRLAQQLSQPGLAQLSRRIAAQRTALLDLVAYISNSRKRKNAVHGLLFAPLFDAQQTVAASEVTSGSTYGLSSPWLLINWKAIASHSRLIGGRRVGFSPSVVAAWCVMALLGLWCAGSMIAAASNRSTIANAEETADRLQKVQKPIAAALDLDELQKQIDTLEIRKQEGAPWYSRFGLNHDDSLLAALWPHYQAASNRILTDPLRRQLEANLLQRNGMSDRELASGGEAQVKAAYGDLKTYLMLAEPKHTEAAFLIPHWQDSGQPAMPSQSQMTQGGWRDLSQRLISFHANHLAAHKEWAITPDAALVGSARQSLIAVIGLQNSTDVLYQSILDENSSKYPPVSLQTLLGGTSSRGLFSTDATIPGIYTRAAWDERISKAIDDADQQRNVDHDWVLSESAGGSQPQATGRELKTELRNRYFSDYARAWQTFLNSVQWQSDSSLSGTIDQLTLLADAQRSPLSALFKAISYQAGAGTLSKSLSDNLVNRAQQLVKGVDADPSKAIVAAPDESPLADAFGPLLRLGNSGGAAANGAAGQSADMSLARYLERVTAVRLKLQQIMMSSDPDAVSRITAQAILQGKTSDIADSRDYASRVGASLGEQWSGFGSAVFERPLEQTWGVVLRPAAASLNDTWRSAIVTAWNSSFGGRYPFADSDNDASLPEMARFLRSDGGLIPQFVATQLAGMLERQGDQWVPTQGSGNTLTLDPNFIDGLNRLTRISNRLFPQADAKVRFELKPVGTGGVTDMVLKSGSQSLHYFNQREEWQPMIWPSDALTGDSRIEWRTEQSGLRSELGADGRFGLIRLLGKAQVTQIDNAQYLLTWKADGSSGVPLRMLLRSEAGAGPLDMLSLRHFVLPTQVFVSGKASAAATKQMANAASAPASAVGNKKASRFTE